MSISHFTREKFICEKQKTLTLYKAVVKDLQQVAPLLWQRSSVLSVTEARKFDSGVFRYKTRDKIDCGGVGGTTLVCFISILSNMNPAYSLSRRRASSTIAFLGFGQEMKGYWWGGGEHNSGRDQSYTPSRRRASSTPVFQV